MRENTELWGGLFERAAAERDPEKLHELAKEISWALELKEQRLRGKGRPIKVFDVAWSERGRKVS